MPRSKDATYLDIITLGAYRWVPRDKVRRGEGSKSLGNNIAVIATGCLVPRLAATNGVVTDGSAWRGLRRWLRQISRIVVCHAVPVVGPKPLAVAIERGVPLVKQVLGDVGISLEYSIAGVALGKTGQYKQWKPLWKDDLQLQLCRSFGSWKGFHSAAGMR